MRELLLGLNAWTLLVIVPLLGRVPQLGDRAGARTILFGLGSLALAVLGGGLWRRSSFALLGVYPVTLALPATLLHHLVPGSVLPPVALLLATASLCVYLAATASRLHEERVARIAVASRDGVQRRRVPSAMPGRWHRRRRIYRGVAATALILPVVLLCQLHLWPPMTQQLDESFGEAATRVRALFTIGIAVLWTYVFRAHLVGVLEGHLQHDRQVLSAMAEARRQARTGRPRPGFYFAVAVALVAMTALVLDRVRS